MIKLFDRDINLQLRKLYIECLSSTITKPDGTLRQRARHIPSWEAIPECMDMAPDVLTNNTWIWSDIHLGHDNVIKYSDRPFRDGRDMDEQFIMNYNSCVGVNDICIWVGDVSFRNSDLTKALIRRMNGYKILIVGNHDFDKKKRLKPMAFDEVHLTYNMQLDDTVLAFTHYPMDNLPKGWFNVHGHVHKNGHRADEIDMPTHINVNCEFIDYKPIPLQTLFDMIKAKQEAA